MTPSARSSPAPELGALPAAYQRLSEVLRDPNANSDRIAEVVRLDPGFTARLLRLANSAAYSGTSRIDSVAQAATRIGSKQLQNLALSTAVVQMFRGMPEHLLDMRSFWTHSVAVGFATAAIARATGMTRTEGPFLHGLLHDVGTLMMGISRPGDVRKVLVATENAGRPHHAMELEILGFSHADVGSAMMESWGLPQMVVDTIRFHHRPEEATEACRRDVDLVHVADVVVSAMKLGNGGERAAHGLDPSAWTRVGLDVRDLSKILLSLEQQVKQLVPVLLGN